MKAHTLAILFLLATVFAQTATAAPWSPVYPSAYPRSISTDKAASTHPGAIVKNGIGKLRRFIKSGRAQHHEQTQTFMTTEIEPYFDFEYMTRWAAGPAWRRMSPQQRARAQDNKLKKAFTNTLVQKLVTYGNQPIRYFTPRGQDSNDVRVRVWIMQPNGSPTRFEFRFYRSEGQWKIFDVKAGGKSAVLHYRNQFRNSFYPNSRARY